jgi:hypothetical protein
MSTTLFQFSLSLSLSFHLCTYNSCWFRYKVFPDRTMLLKKEIPLPSGGRGKGRRRGKEKREEKGEGR